MRAKLQSVLPSLLLAAVLGAIYALTLAPDLTWANNGADGGDLMSAAYRWGVPHPSGYPLYMLLARAAQALPLGGMALRTNLLSAGLSIAGALVSLRLMSLVAGEWAGWPGALALGLAPAIWGQAVITEVYPLHFFLAALILWQAFGPPRADVLRGLVFGLGLSNHVTSIFLLPALLLDAGNWQRDVRRLALRGGWAVLSAALLYATLMLRASAHPPVNWGAPVTPGRLLALVSGQIYQEYIGQAGADLAARIPLLLGDISIQFGLGALALGLVGLFFAPAPRALRLLTGFIGLVSIGFVLFYNTADGFVYLLPFYSLLAAWLALGLKALADWLDGLRLPGRQAAFLLVMLLIGWNAARNWPQVDASRDLRAREFVESTWQKTPAQALLFTRDDRASLSLWYSQFVEARRPDVAIIIIGLLDYDWYQQMLRDTYPDLLIPADAANLRDAITRANDRPACLVLADPVIGFTCD
jgi:hypothetical protein